MVIKEILNELCEIHTDLKQDDISLKMLKRFWEKQMRKAPAWDEALWR